MIPNVPFLKPTEMSRRKALTIFTASASITFSPKAFAYSTCDPFEPIKKSALAEQGLIDSGLYSVDPQAIVLKKNAIRDARIKLNAALELNTTDARRTALSAINLAGGAIFTLIGVGATAAAAPAIFLGTVVFSNAIIIATALNSPRAPDVVNVIASASVEKAANVTQIYSQSTYAVNPNIRAFTSAGGRILSRANLLFSVFSLAKDGYEWWDSSQQIDLLRSTLNHLENELDKLNNQRTINTLRKQCLLSFLDSAVTKCTTPPG